jgi:hypothetical protein
MALRRIAEPIKTRGNAVSSPRLALGIEADSADLLKRAGPRFICGFG